MTSFVSSHKIPRGIKYFLIGISLALVVGGFIAIKLLKWSWAWAVVTIFGLLAIGLILWPTGRSEKPAEGGKNKFYRRQTEAAEKVNTATTAFERVAAELAESEMELEDAEAEKAEADARVARFESKRAKFLTRG